MNWQLVIGWTYANELASLLVETIQNVIHLSSKQFKVSPPDDDIKPWITRGLLTCIRHRGIISKRVYCQPFNENLINFFRKDRNAFIRYSNFEEQNVTIIKMRLKMQRDILN